MSKERYNEIIDEVYQQYDELFDSYYPPFSAPYPTRLTKEELVEEIKKGGHDELGVKIAERELSLEERYNLMPSITGHAIPNIEMRKRINNFDGNIPGISYHEEWLDSFNIPTKEIKVTYNNETITVYE